VGLTVLVVVVSCGLVGCVTVDLGMLLGELVVDILVVGRVAFGAAVAEQALTENTAMPEPTIPAIFRRFLLVNLVVFSIVSEELTLLSLSISEYINIWCNICQIAIAFNILS